MLIKLFSEKQPRLKAASSQSIFVDHAHRRANSQQALLKTFGELNLFERLRV
jgi:hypothetical protein